MIRFEMLDNIKKILAQPEKPAVRLTRDDYDLARQYNIAPEEILQKKQEQHLKAISEQRKMTRIFTVNTNEKLELAPKFNERLLNDPQTFEKTHTKVFINQATRPQILLNIPSERYPAPPITLKPVDRVIRLLENAGKVSKNIHVFSNKQIIVHSADNYIKLQKVINKLYRNKRTVTFYNGLGFEATFNRMFKFAKQVKLEDHKLLQQVLRVLPETSELFVEFPTEPTLYSLGGYLPQYKKAKINPVPDLPEHLYRYTQGADYADYKITATAPLMDCQCKYCDKKTECQFVKVETETFQLSQNFLQQRKDITTRFIEMLENEVNRINAKPLIEETKQITYTYEDVVFLLKTFGIYNYNASELEHKEMFLQLNNTPISADLIDYEFLATYDRDFNTFKYEIYEYGERLYHKLLEEFAGRVFAEEVHNKLDTYKFNASQLIYVGKVQYLHMSQSELENL